MRVRGPALHTCSADRRHPRLSQTLTRQKNLCILRHHQHWINFFLLCRQVVVGEGVVGQNTQALCIQLQMYIFLKGDGWKASLRLYISECVGSSSGKNTAAAEQAVPEVRRRRTNKKEHSYLVSETQMCCKRHFFQRANDAEIWLCSTAKR